MNFHTETGRRAAQTSSTGKCQPRESMLCGLEDCDHEVIDIIIGFVGFHAYIAVASVSTHWRDAWEQRPRVTSPEWAVQSCSCLDWAMKCSLDVYHRPCLLAAAEGRLGVLQHAIALGYSREGMAICERAAAGGHLEVVKWCRAHGYPWGLSKLLAAEGGHLEVLQWCIASRAPGAARESLAVVGSDRILRRIPGISETAVLNAAVEGGHLKTVKWCWQQGYRWNGDTCYLAAKGGHMEMLRWLRDKGCPWSLDTMVGAAKAGDLKMFEWCRANGCPWHEYVRSAAASQGNLQMVKWCVGDETAFNALDRACSDAAAAGHLEVLQWLRGIGYRWGYDLCFLALCEGHFEVLKWCIANGCSWDNVPWDGAKLEFKGTVPMMVWATENGCPWMADPSAMNSLCWYAAVGGNLEVLKWCATIHRIAESDVLETVAGNGHVHILEWLRVNTGILGRYVNTDGTLCSMAASSGSLETVRWCRANNHPWCRETCTAAARSGNLELLQWCRANGCPWGDDTCKAVIDRGDFEMLAWCRDNGCPPERGWLQSSLMSGHEEMIEWSWR